MGRGKLYLSIQVTLRGSIDILKILAGLGNPPPACTFLLLNRCMKDFAAQNKKLVSDGQGEPVLSSGLEFRYKD